MNSSIEQILQQQNLELEKKNKALDEYAFINSHHLRAPVARILGLVELCSHMELPPEAQEIISRMKSESENLDAVVRNISKVIQDAESNQPGLNKEQNT